MDSKHQAHTSTSQMRPRVRPNKQNQRMIAQLKQHNPKQDNRQGPPPAVPTRTWEQGPTGQTTQPHTQHSGRQAGRQAGSKHAHPATDNELLLFTRSIEGGPTGSGNNPPSSDPYPRATDDPPPLFPPSTGESNGVPMLLRGEAFVLIPPASYSRPSPSGPDLQKH